MSTDLVIAWEANDSGINAHVPALIAEAEARSLSVELFGSGAPDADYPAKPMADFSFDNSTAAVFCAADAGDETLARRFALAGKGVLPMSKDINQALVDDVFSGYVQTKEPWYAKVDQPFHYIADFRQLAVGLGCTINPRAVILNSGVDGKGGLVQIGRATHIGADLLLNLGAANFTVGAFTMISANFSCHGMRHSLSHVSSFCIRKGPFGFFGDVYDDFADISIGSDVWIGEGVTCLPGVTVGDGAVVGAGSVITKSVEPYTVVAGNPAKKIRDRFDNKKASEIARAQWWRLPYQEIKEKQDLFRQDAAAMSEQAFADLCKAIDSSTQR